MTTKEMQEKLSAMNQKGTVLTVSDGDGELFTTVTDSLAVTRTGKKCFWLMWKATGYQEDFHYTHTIKVESWEVDEQDGEQWLVADLEDDQGRRYHLETIHPMLHPKEHKHRKEWMAFKSRNKELFQETDKRLLRDHQEIAEGWK